MFFVVVKSLLYQIKHVDLIKKRVFISVTPWGFLHGLAQYPGDLGSLIKMGAISGQFTIVSYHDL